MAHYAKKITFFDSSSSKSWCLHKLRGILPLLQQDWEFKEDKDSTILIKILRINESEKQISIV